jgi:prepilin-type N-terminal cleavage/methylation domain-containing protein
MTEPITRELRLIVRGFSLVEMLVVVVVAATLASFAIPAYRSYIVRGCRTDALLSLEQVASAQEQYFFQFNNYSSVVRDLDVTEYSFQRHYRMQTGWILDDPSTFFATAVQSTEKTCLPENDIQFRIDDTGLLQFKIPGLDWIPYKDDEIHNL